MTKNCVSVTFSYIKILDIINRSFANKANVLMYIHTYIQTHTHICMTTPDGSLWLDLPS
jgi:hypothetical protein